MSILEELKDCHTCMNSYIEDGNLICDIDGIKNKCIYGGRMYWVIRLACKTCEQRDGSIVEYQHICQPCFLDDFAAWKSSWWNETTKPVVFKVPY